MSVRKIIQIDEELCNGCGECVPACAEGAIQIIDGKARLMADNLCDGLGACLGDCPEGALKIIDREADEFDELAVEQQTAPVRPTAPKPAPAPHPHAFGGCPSARVLQFGDQPPAPQRGSGGPEQSALGHWPIKLRLVPPGAPFLKGRDLVLAADCVGFAFTGTNSELLAGNAVVIGCPKFDDFETDLQRLTATLRQSDVRSLTVAHMEVPCCHAYVHLARQAVAASGKDIPVRRVEIAMGGQVKPQARQSLLG